MSYSPTWSVFIRSNEVVLVKCATVKALDIFESLGKEYSSWQNDEIFYTYPQTYICGSSWGYMSISHRELWLSLDLPTHFNLPAIIRHPNALVVDADGKEITCPHDRRAT